MYSDEMTAKKLKLEYDRVLVNVKVGDNLPKEIKIRSPGGEISQVVKYEWIPIARNAEHGDIWRGGVTNL